jgi:chromate transporter
MGDASHTHDPQPSRGPSLLSLLAIFFRVGNTTFGGGEPTISLLFQDLVRQRGWMTPSSFGLVYALARLTPGTNMLAFVAGAGWVLQRVPGAVLGVAVVTLPSALLVVLVTQSYLWLQQNAYAMGALRALMAAAVAFMLGAAWFLFRGSWKRGARLRTAVIAAGAFAAIAWLRLPPLQVLALAAILACFWKDPEEPSA